MGKPSPSFFWTEKYSSCFCFSEALVVPTRHLGSLEALRRKGRESGRTAPETRRGPSHLPPPDPGRSESRRSTSSLWVPALRRDCRPKTLSGSLDGHLSVRRGAVVVSLFPYLRRHRPPEGRRGRARSRTDGSAVSGPQAGPGDTHRVTGTRNVGGEALHGSV